MTKIFIESAPEATLGKRRADGAYPIVLITPGQGTSGYYREDVIQRDAPDAFPKGTHVYLDHLKEGESRSPERLLGTLVEETVVNGDGEAGNWFLPLRKHAEWVEDVHGIVGFSVAVAGEGTPGEVEGRKTLIVESLTPSLTNTVDIVSYAGRGGRFLESYIAEVVEQSTQPEPSDGATKGNETMATVEEGLATLTATVQGLVTALTIPAPEAPADVAVERALVVEALVAVEAADISDETKAELREGIKAGKYDVTEAIAREARLKAALTESLTESIKATLTEAGAGAGGASSADDYNVKGWGK